MGIGTWMGTGTGTGRGDRDTGGDTAVNGATMGTGGHLGTGAPRGKVRFWDTRDRGAPGRVGGDMEAGTWGQWGWGHQDTRGSGDGDSGDRWWGHPGTHGHQDTGTWGQWGHGQGRAPGRTVWRGTRGTPSPKPRRWGGRPLLQGGPSALGTPWGQRGDSEGALTVCGHSARPRGAALPVEDGAGGCKERRRRRHPGRGHGEGVGEEGTGRDEGTRGGRTGRWRSGPGATHPSSSCGRGGPASAS